MTARALLKAGAKIFLANANGESAFDVAVKKDHHDLVDMIIAFCYQVGKVFSLSQFEYIIFKR